jgi:hypothetical protein
MNRQHHVACAALLVLTAISSAQASTDDARANALKWLIQTQHGDGSFVGPNGLTVQSTAGAVEAMRAGGLQQSPQYSRALAWLANAAGGSLDARAWQAGALAAAGRDALPVAAAIRDERNTYMVQSGNLLTGNVATWGAYPGYGASTIDTALGYGALRSAAVSYPNDTGELVVTVLCNILPAQLGASPWSGAWPHALPQNGQPSHASTGALAATAGMLYEFKRQRQAGRFLSASACGKSSPGAIDTSMTSAKTWLIAQANGDGGFAERNPQTGNLEVSSPVATALGIRALALFAAEGDAAASAAINNARNWLVGQQNADGSWRGDPFVTARVVAALPAATGAQLTDSDQDGITDVVEQQLGTQVLVADAQGQLNPSANALSGLTTTAFSVTGNLNEAFSYTLSASGGVAPYTFARINGSLPPGLSVATDGLISGAPSALGSYAFDYEITDAASSKTLVIGRIDVVNAVPVGNSDGDVPLPAWAMVVLGAGLLGAMRRYSTRASARPHQPKP